MIRIDPDKENQVVELARSGNRPNEISSETGLPPHYVRKLIQKHNIKIVAKPNSKTVDIYFIISSLLRGESLTDIAERFNVTRQYIFLIKQKCKESGIPVPE
jgi:hypothetical protein